MINAKNNNELHMQTILERNRNRQHYYLPTRHEGVVLIFCLFLTGK